MFSTSNVTPTRPVFTTPVRGGKAQVLQVDKETSRRRCSGGAPSYWRTEGHLSVLISLVEPAEQRIDNEVAVERAIVALEFAINTDGQSAELFGVDQADFSDYEYMHLGAGVWGAVIEYDGQAPDEELEPGDGEILGADFWAAQRGV